MAAPAVAAVAVVAAAAYSAAQENKAAGTQQRLDDAATTLNLANRRLEIESRKEVQAKSFRQQLAQQVAMASMRGGPGLTAQFATQSFSNYQSDMATLNRQSQTAAIQAQNAYAQSAAQRSAVRQRGFSNIISAGLNAFSQSSFTSGGQSAGFQPGQRLSGPANMSGGTWVNPNG